MSLKTKIAAGTFAGAFSILGGLTAASASSATVAQQVQDIAGFALPGAATTHPTSTIHPTSTSTDKTDSTTKGDTTSDAHNTKQPSCLTGHGETVSDLAQKPADPGTTHGSIVSATAKCVSDTKANDAKGDTTSSAAKDKADATTPGATGDTHADANAPAAATKGSTNAGTNNDGSDSTANAHSTSSGHRP